MIAYVMLQMEKKPRLFNNRINLLWYHLPVIVLIRLNLFFYLAFRYTLSFFLSYDWCYSDYAGSPLCELSSRLLNDAKECHIAFSSSSSPYIYESSNPRERERKDMRNTKKDITDGSVLFACLSGLTTWPSTNN